MIENFPPDNGKARDDMILDCVKNNLHEVRFSTIESTYKGHVGKFHVFQDALKIDGVRINVSATLEQQIADILSCSLLTVKLADLRWHQAQIRINPCPRTISSTTEAMKAHSVDVDKALTAAGYSNGMIAGPTGQLEYGLVSTVGKHWVLDNSLLNKPGKACNYGWHFTTGSTYKGIKGSPNPTLLKNPKTGMYWNVIQGRGWAHDSLHHSDYSQQCVLVTRECVIDGVARDIMDIFADKDLSYLINIEGPLKYTRIV